MNRIYLLITLLVAFTANSFAQGVSSRVADLAIKHYVTRNGEITLNLMNDGDSVFINDGVSHPYVVRYRFIVNIKNNGPDDLISTDTVRVRGYLFNFKGDLRTIGASPGGLKSGDSVFFSPGFEQPTVLLPNATFQPLYQTVPWCDTILFAYDVKGDTIKEGTGANTITNNLTCDTTVIVVWRVSIDEMEVLPKEMLLFPNPATNRLDIRYNFVETATDVSVVVLNSTGQVVIRQNFSGNYHQTATLPLDVSKLNAGMYFVKLSAGNGDVVSTKFNVTR